MIIKKASIEELRVNLSSKQAKLYELRGLFTSSQGNAREALDERIYALEMEIDILQKQHNEAKVSSEIVESDDC